ncbi:ComF family protein [Bacillus songklensis]|uniref:ComF family protein n=1 Tax=Bacillus songklensis TaxID=1069116 RepID=A0ABV8BAI6_9BACI
MNEHCLICDQMLKRHLTWTTLLFPSEQPVICERCEGKFQLIEGDICQVCGRPFQELEESYRKGEHCLDCVRWEENEGWSGLLRQNRSLYLYNDWMKEMMALYKFRGDYKLSEVFQRKWVKLYQAHYDSSYLVVPIPLSEERLYERGFNQSVVLANFLAQPVHDLLERHHVEKQSQKTRKERLETDQLFRVKNKAALEGKSVLLIDDIYTTGTTLRHAAKGLSEVGCKSVSSLTLARG